MTLVPFGYIPAVSRWKHPAPSCNSWPLWAPRPHSLHPRIQLHLGGPGRFRWNVLGWPRPEQQHACPVIPPRSGSRTKALQKHTHISLVAAQVQSPGLRRSFHCLLQRVDMQTRPLRVYYERSQPHSGSAEPGGCPDVCTLCTFPGF